MAVRGSTGSLVREEQGSTQEVFEVGLIRKGIMHLPLLLSSDAVLKNRKPWPSLHWIGEDARKVFLISRHIVGEVDLLTGSSSKVSQLYSMTKLAAAINYTYDGTFVYGILTSGDIFFWNQSSKSLSQAQGIPDLVTHLPHATDRDSDDGPLQVILDFFKQLRPQNLGGNEAMKDAQSSHNCSVPSHHKPNIFASNDCSKVIVVLGASQVHLWERDLTRSFDEKNSSYILGHWSVVMCPSDVPLPCLQSRETQVTSCFLPEGSLGKQCHITFSFVGASCLVITTLTLQWGSSRDTLSAGRVLASYWNSISVSHQAIGMREAEVLQKKGTLISRYAHCRSLICIAVNSSQQQCSKLLFLHPFCNTAVVISVCDAVHQQDLHNANSTKSHWVSDLAWSRDDTYVVGCLRSGAIFLATRMGSLVNISCTGRSLQLQPSIILPLHPLSIPPNKEVGTEDVSSSSESFAPSRPTFCVSCHPLKDQFLLSSGFRVSVLALPENGRRDAEVVDQLLTEAKHALYLLQNSSLTHDYAYIRCSTWRLAQSMLDLSKNLNKSASAQRCEISLWDKKNPDHEECKPHSNNHADEGEQLIEQVMKPLLAAWTLIVSHRGPQTNDWKGKAKHVVRHLVKLVGILMQTSLNDDYSEHQAMLLQMLHIFHHFVKVLAVWPKSLHMVKPTIWLTHQIIHTLLRCEKHAGESSMVDTLLILTQALSSVECTLTQVYTFRPVLQFPSQLLYDILGDASGIEVTNVTAISNIFARDGTFKSNPAVCLRMKILWICLHLNSNKVYLRLGEKKFEQKIYQKLLTVMNIIQSRLQLLGFDFGHRKVKLDRCDQFYLNGIYLSAVKDWKFKSIKNLSHKRDRRKVGKYFHSILYTYLLHKDFIGISDFLSWLYSLIRSSICTTNPSSLPNNALSSTPKPKKDNHVPPQEITLDVSQIKQETMRTYTPDTVETSGGSQTQQISNQVSASTKEDRDAFSQKCNHSDEELQNTIRLVAVVRQVIGSLGRIMAKVILQHDIYIPSPHNPHVIPPIWDSSSKLRDKDATTLCPTMMKDVIFAAHWSSETVAQALAVAGYWSDITAFSHELGDTRTALVSSLIALTTEKSRLLISSSLHPSSIIKNLVLHSGPIENLKASVFHSYQELMQVASMSCLDVIPNILQDCLQKIQEVMQHFEVFVPSHVYLPAPPVFCPQVTSGLNHVLQSPDDIMIYDERILRKELAGWVRLFCSVISAAGIAQPLLKELCHACQQYPRKVSGEYNEELSNLAETLGPVQVEWSPHGPEWSRILQLWQKFVSQLWILHARDKLSLCIRKFTVDISALYQRKISQETHAAEILSWVEELHKLIDADTWKDELIATALTAASNAPPHPVIAQALANIIPEPAGLPSLLKDKAARLFDLWKNTDVVVTEVREESLGVKEKSGKHKSLIETYAKLYNIYDKRCAELIFKRNFHSGDQRGFSSDDSIPYCNGNISHISCDVQTTSETVKEEFRKFGFLFASMTFARDAEMFPQHFAQVPQLVQFSNEIKKREFQGLRIKSHISQSIHNDNIEQHEQNVLDFTDHMSLLDVTSSLSSGKKGFFRNLDSKILQGGRKTVFHLYDQTFLDAKKTGRSSRRNRSLSPLQKKYSVNQRNPSFHTSKETDSSGSSYKPEYFTYKTVQNKNKRHQMSERRSRSHSTRRKRGTSFSSIKSMRSQSSSSIWLQEKSKSRLLDLNDTATFIVNQNPPLNLLLSLSKSYSCSVGNEKFQEMIKLVHWLMSSERRLCFPTVTPSIINNTSKHSTIKKVDLNLKDIILALNWEYLCPSNLHNTHLKKTAVPFEHGKKASTETMELEVLVNKANKDMKGDQSHKQSPTVNSTVPSHGVIITDTKVIDHEQEYVTLPYGSEDEHSFRGTVKEKAAKTISFLTSRLKTVGEIGDSDVVNVMTTNSLQKTEQLPEKDKQNLSNQKITADGREDAIDGKDSCSLHENRYKPESSIMSPDLGQENGITSNSCHQGMAPDIVIDDDDGKVSDSMNMQTNCNLEHQVFTSITRKHSPMVEDSCKSTEFKKTEVDESSDIIQDSSPGPQNSVTSFRMTVQDAVREELKTIFQLHPLGLLAEARPSNNMSQKEMSEKVQLGESSEGFQAKTPILNVTSIMSLKSESENEEIVNDGKISSKRLDKEKTVNQHSTIDAVAQYSESKKSLELFRANNKSFHIPEPLVIEVKEAEKPAFHLRVSPYEHQKKESLTPVEEPSEIFYPDVGVSLKLLHMPPEKHQDSKRLSIADVCDGDASAHNQSVVLAVDDTLDDVTLPDSLHASDLDENYCTLPSQNIVQENIIKRSRFQFSKKTTKGEASCKLNTTVTLKKAVDHDTKEPVRWDEKKLFLKSLPVQVKPVSTNVVHNLGGQSTLGNLETQSFIEKSVNVNKTLKLLTLPKQLPQNVETIKDYSPLLLKQLPTGKVLEAEFKKTKTLVTLQGKGCPDSLCNKQNSKQHIKFVKAMPPKDMALLTIPKCSQVKECGGPDSICFLDPKQVLKFCAANIMKKRQNRFKTLKVNKLPKFDNLIDIYEKEMCIEDQSENKKEISKSDAQEEKLDKGFLDRVKEYAYKYETGALRDVLVKGNDNRDGTARSRFQYEATQKMDKIYQNHPQHFQSTRETQTLPQQLNNFQRCETSEFKEVLIKKNEERDGTVGSRFHHESIQKMDKLYQSQSQHFHITRETQTYPQDLDLQVNESEDDREIKKKTFSDLKAVGTQAVLAMEENEAENKYNVISSSLSQRASGDHFPMKLMETRMIKVRDSWTETDFIGSKHNLPHEGHEVQTQTPVKLTKDTSVTVRITPSCDPQSPRDGYFPSHPLPKENLPLAHQTPPQEDFSPYCTPPPADSSRDIVDIVNIPQEIVQQHLEVIQDELNKSRDHETVKQEIVSSSSAAEKNQRHADTLGKIRNGETEFKRIDCITRLQTDDSSLETYTHDICFKQNESLRKQYRIRGNTEKDIQQTDSKDKQKETKLAEDRLHATTPDLASERVSVGSDRIMMNELIEAFSDGRITFEDLCKMSSTVQRPEKEQSLEEMDDGGNIERLEQQTVEAAQSLHETRNLMAKLNYLLQTSDIIETERLNALRSTSLDGSNRHPSAVMRKKSSHEILGWQETLSAFKESGNPDTLLGFIEDIDPKDITNEMIDEIIKFEETSSRKHSSHHPLSSQDISNIISKTYVCEGIAKESLEDVKTNDYLSLSRLEFEEFSRHTDEGSSDRVNNLPASNYLQAKMNSKVNVHRTENYLNEPQAMPELHLDLSGLRSGSSNSFPCTSHQGSMRQHAYSLDPDEKKLRRRAEIRTWMKKRRKKQMEQAQAVPQNTITKTHLSTYRNLADSKKHAESALVSLSSIQVENKGLSGKQLRESSQEREERRIQLRKDHQHKREEEMLKLLADHEEELTSHRTLIVKRLPYESPRIPRSVEKRKIALKNISHHIAGLPSAKANVKIQKRTHVKQKCNSKLPQTSISKPYKLETKKSKLSEGKTCFTDNADVRSREGQSASVTDDLSSLTISSHSCKVSSDRNGTYVLEKINIESDSSVQARLDSLVKCLRSSEKDKSLTLCRDSENEPHGSLSSSLQLKNNHVKRCEKSKIEQKPFDASQRTLISSNDKFHQEKSSSEAFYQMNSTFTLPLDRISEVDSNVSADSLLNGNSQEKENESFPRRPNGDTTEQEDTSGESSWNVPNDVKKLLYG